MGVTSTHSSQVRTWFLTQLSAGTGLVQSGTAGLVLLWHLLVLNMLQTTPAHLRTLTGWSTRFKYTSRQCSSGIKRQRGGCDELCIRCTYWNRTFHDPAHWHHIGTIFWYHVNGRLRKFGLSCKTQSALSGLRQQEARFERYSDLDKMLLLLMESNRWLLLGIECNKFKSYRDMLMRTSVFTAGSQLVFILHRQEEHRQLPNSIMPHSSASAHRQHIYSHQHSSRP